MRRKSGFNRLLISVASASVPSMSATSTTKAFITCNGVAAINKSLGPIGVPERWRVLGDGREWRGVPRLRWRVPGDGRERRGVPRLRWWVLGDGRVLQNQS